MKTLVLDSSSLISLSESCVITALRFLKTKLNAEFGVPPSVYQESVERPYKIKRYAFSAMRIKMLFSEGVVKRVGARNDLTEELLALANNLFFIEGRPLELLQLGEAECAAAVLGSGGGGLVIDEKTLRLLVEAPSRMQELLRNEYQKKISMKAESLERWRNLTRGLKIIRSAEVLVIAARCGYFGSFGEDELFAARAAIYSLRGYGCSLTNDELADFESLVGGR